MIKYLKTLSRLLPVYHVIYIKETVRLDGTPRKLTILIGVKRIPNRDKCPRARRSFHALGDGPVQSRGHLGIKVSTFYNMD